MKAVIAIILTFASLCSVAQQTQNNIAPAVHFIENKGQWDENILFKADLDYTTIYLEKNCITFDLANPEDLEKIHHPFHQQDSIHSNIINKHCYKLWFEGCNAEASIEKNIQSRSYNNYFIGRDQNKWASKVYSFAEITYKEIYPGIDLKIYSKGENFKYDFIVQPGADIKNIKLRYEGLDNIYEVNNTLQLSASFAKFSESEPVAYIQTEYYTLPVQCKYLLQQNILSFNIPQLYDKNYPLIIDPELIFASYTGSSQDNWGYTATYDLDGNLYGGGIVFGSGYPVTTGAYQTSFGGGDFGAAFDPYDNGCDIGISKFSADGSTLLYSTYIGGGSEELPHSLITNSDGELFIYGTTGSDDFPVTSGAYDASYNGGDNVTVDEVIAFPEGTDIFIAKLSADGSDMLACTYVGGTENDGSNLASATQYNYGDFARGEIMIDETNNVYVASSTTSSDFPVSASAFQTTYEGVQDGVVFKLNSSLSSLTWSTYLGGSAADGAFSLKRNSSGEVIVGGGTASSDFPVTAGAWYTTFQGGSADGWVVKLNSSGTTEIAGTYVGTSSYDQVYFVEKDDDDKIYFTGQTKGSYFVSAGAYSETGGKQFITKLNSALTSVDYSMVFGSGTSAVNISPSAFLVDDCQNVYVSGWGGNVNNIYFPSTGNTSGMSITPDAIQSTTDGSDFYFFVLQKNAVDILFGSYFGGAGDDEHVDGGTSRFDKSGTIYQGVCAGCGGSDGFPTTAGAYSETNGSINCNLGVGKIKLDLAGVYAISEADPSISGCAPFTVLFDNLSSDAEEYIWNFGDGSASSTAFEPTHTYTDVGTYTVELVVIDSSTCNIADTAYLTIEVSNGNIVPDIDYTIEQDCDSLVLTTINNSVEYDATEYYWSFGDGTTSTLEEPVHIYTLPGTYLVQFVISDSTSCNKFDTIEFEINYLNDFNTGYDVTTDGCLPVTATFHADFDDADAYFWDLGDGTTATTQDVVHDYFVPGTYTITLTITYCGYTDEYTDYFTVFELPTAYFDPEPSFGIANAPTTFYNLSENAATYLWEFSDGTTSTELNPVKYFPGLGTFEVCLTAYNLAGCPDTYCRDISIENAGAADIPTGFSPNGDGANDVLYVKGFGFARMHLEVFNRWGQLVFETYTQKIGWDGTYKGKPLDMDVFVFKLTVDFTDGKHFEKTGNVTLIR